jgi:hypothetical protein
VAELQSQLQDTRMRLQVMQEQQNQMMVRLNSHNSTLQLMLIRSCAHARAMPC